jgi:hypothetical protein
LFLLFGTITDLLKYDYNRDFAIFDQTESKNPISFQLQFFEFLVLSLLTATQATSSDQHQTNSLSYEEDTKMTTFIVDALDFLHLTEIRAVIKSDTDFEGTFEGVVCPLFMLLHRKLTMFG